MIERQGKKLFVICDVCGKRQYWKDFEYGPRNIFPLPPDWESYRVFTSFLVFCPNTNCKKALTCMSGIERS